MAKGKTGVGRAACIAAAQLRKAGATVEWHDWGMSATAGKGFKLWRGFRYIDSLGSLVDAGEVDYAAALFARKKAREN